MRIIKLSTTPPTGFATFEDVRRFFDHDIRQTKPPGIFHVTPGRIAQGGLKVDEPLIFTYQARVVFTARAGSPLLPNEDDERDKYPSYFLVDLGTLREADTDFHDVEREYNQATGVIHNLVESQGWNQLPDSDHSGGIWSRLAGSPIAGSRLTAEEAVQLDPNQAEVYIPDGVDRRRLVERQIRERRGQQQFRDALRQRYGDRCMITGCEVLAVVEAAHISPYRGEDDNNAENGLLLRSDIHTLFDLDLLGIDPEGLGVELHQNLVAEYGRLVGLTVTCPGHQRPSREALRLRHERYCQRCQRPA